MRPTLPLEKGDEGTCISDLHRKLSNIRKQLHGESTDSCNAFLCGTISDVYGKSMAETINVFKKRFLPESNADGVCDVATWELLSEMAGNSFSEVWQYELDALQLGKDAAEAQIAIRPDISADEQDDQMRARHDPTKSRRRNTDKFDIFQDRHSGPKDILKARPANEDDVIASAHVANLAGLAFSGGGIRSATFNLGILQALAERKMLNDFDYLSTVSGGGYIGSWFSAWLKRLHGKMDTVMDKLAPGTADKPLREEPDEIRFLRQYSNYLTPRAGMFSADTWALLATYFRNTTLNLTILAALLGAGLILPHLLAYLAGTMGKDHPALFAWIGTATILWAVFYFARSISSTPHPTTDRWGASQSQSRVLLGVVLPLQVSAYCASVAVWSYRDQFVHPALIWMIILGIAFIFAWISGFVSAQHSDHRSEPSEEEKQEYVKIQHQKFVDHVWCAVIALALGIVMLIWCVSTLNHWDAALEMLDGPARGMLLVSYGVPLMLGIFGMAMVFAVGLVGRMYDDKSRESLSRQAGWASIYTLAWLSITAVALYAAPMLGYLYANLKTWEQAAVGSIWLACCSSMAMRQASVESVPI